MLPTVGDTGWAKGYGEKKVYQVGEERGHKPGVPPDREQLEGGGGGGDDTEYDEDNSGDEKEAEHGYSSSGIGGWEGSVSGSGVGSGGSMGRVIGVLVVGGGHRLGGESRLDPSERAGDSSSGRSD